MDIEAKEIRVLKRFYNNMLIDHVYIKPYNRPYVDLCFNEWYKNKNIFRFENDSINKICKKDIEIERLCELLQSLPYKCVYINDGESAFDAASDVRSYGLWVMKKIKDETYLQLIITILTGETSAYPIVVPIRKNDTIDECIIGSKYSIPASYTSSRITDDLYLTKMRGIINRALCLVMHICEQNQIRYNYTVAKHSCTVSVLQKEIQDWDVDIRYIHANQTLHEAIESPNKEDTGTHKSHTSPRPHIRRGHWKRVWYGKRSNPKLRKQKIIWISETCVNKTTSVPDTLPIVIRNKAE